MSDFNGTNRGPAAPAPRRRSLARRLLLGVGILVLMGSVLLNFALALAVIGLSAFSEPRLHTRVTQPGKDDQVVAVVAISGVIAPEHVSLVRSFCDRVSNDANVKAVVLRVESPGGGVSVCDRLYKHVGDLKRKGGKKLVVSMGGVAASGGYYVSTPADAIYAEHTTVTGSLGVVGGWAVFKGTMDKLGIKWVIVRSSSARAWKASRSPLEDPADYQVAEVQKTVDEMHDRFRKIVLAERPGVKVTAARKTYTGADGKEFTVIETEPFNGKVFLAERARQLGLVDEIGYLDDAIAGAAKLAGLTDPKVVVYKRRGGLLAEIGLTRSRTLSLDLLDRLQTPQLMMLWRVDP